MPASGEERGKGLGLLGAGQRALSLSTESFLFFVYHVTCEREAFRSLSHCPPFLLVQLAFLLLRGGGSCPQTLLPRGCNVTPVFSLIPRPPCPTQPMEGTQHLNWKRQPLPLHCIPGGKLRPRVRKGLGQGHGAALGQEEEEDGSPGSGCSAFRCIVLAAPSGSLLPAPSLESDPVAQPELQMSPDFSPPAPSE